MSTVTNWVDSLLELPVLKKIDLLTQPRFLLPTVFPVIVYLGWTYEGGSLSTHLVAALLIALGGWVGAMIIEYQPFVPISDGTVNELQGVLLCVVAAVIYGTWSLYGWPSFVQGFGLVAATAVFLWLPARQVFTLSGGVIFPTAVFMYMALVDLRLLPLLLVLAVRIPVALKIENLTPLETAIGVSLGCLSVALVVGYPLIGI